MSARALHPSIWTGEVADLLAHLPAGCHCVERPRDGAEPVTDHVIVSPAGIDLVQVRPARGRVGVRTTRDGIDRSMMFVEGVDRTVWLHDLACTLGEIGDALGRTPLSSLRRGWLCLEGADWFELPAGMRLAGFPVLPPRLLAQFLPHRGACSAFHIDAAIARLQDSFAPTRARADELVSA